ncbi:M48 family metallopeptidase [Burkholderia multivorans]|uniref:hypothetical protein n=1 Tax=Burkholderia multivorans TaxID=87883 RepID=UPI001C272BD2|nr:hypothetical protein [Burkholderia multivorans]MBU9549952.1 hypothetical protein [Burkholderia multivorans]MCA7960643.1 M48 family metallopeptidase [Burkholderia multivorans]
MNREEVDRIVDERVSSLLLAYIVGAGIATYGMWRLIGVGAIFIGVALLAIATWKIIRIIQRVPAQFWWSCWIALCIIGIVLVAFCMPKGSSTTQVSAPVSETPKDPYDVSSFGNASTNSGPIVPGVRDYPMPETKTGAPSKRQSGTPEVHPSEIDAGSNFDNGHLAEAIRSARIRQMQEDAMHQQSD